MEILFADDRVVVCVKPAGVLSTDEPGGMPGLLRKALGDDNIRSVHRLDRGVGGVMVYAHTKRAARDLSGQMREGCFEKKYLAVLTGIPEPEAGELSDWLQRDMLAHKTHAVPEGTPDARPARLYYEVLAAGEGLSLVSVRLYTGRTHQIRCQFSARALPIWGDRKYGAAEGERIALWSSCISFRHPRTGERLRFSADPPETEPWTRFPKKGW